MQYHKIFLVVLLILITASPVSAQYGYYTIPIMGLTNSPADSILNYLGNKPSAPETIVNRSVIFMPTNGVIERAEIFDNSTVAGSAEAYSYYVSVNNATDYLIATLAVSQNLRVFSNAAINIPVVAGDKIEIKRKHPAWATNPTGNIVGGYIAINSTIDGYTLSTMGLTSSVANNSITYMGYRPIAPSTTAATNKLFVPMAGNITRADVNDYSGTAGGAQAYNYSLQRNGGMSTEISTLSISANQRLFNNTNLNLNVNRGDYIEMWRGREMGIDVVPATNIVGGTVFVNTNYSCDAHGYPLWFQALTSSPVDGQIVYFGNKPNAPAITAGFNKVYVPKSGTINRAEFYVYSGTAGTKEGWELYIQKNGAGKNLISYSNVSAAERFFKNATMNMPVSAGDYLEIMGIQPTWATNPATTIYGGYVVIDYAASTCDTVTLPPIAQFSVNLTPGPEGMTAQFFSQSNNTIPGSTKYSWNFTDGGTKEDSDLENPTFIYTTAGTYTVRLRVTNPGSITDTMTKNNYITVYVPAATPTPCPVCCDNYTTSLLHYEGADHSVDIIDENSANTWLLRNVGEITTAQKKFGVSSLGLADAGGYAELIPPSATTLDFGKGCWTWETWIRYDDVDPATDHGIFTWGAFGAGNDADIFYQRNIAGDGSYVFNVYDGIMTIGSYVYHNQAGEYNANQWYHLELSRNLSAINFSIDGDQKTWDHISGSFDENTDMGNPGNMTYGFESHDEYYLDGWMDESRLSVGVQRHYGDFAVPTEAYDYDPCTGGSSCTSSGGEDTNYDDGTTLWIIAIPCLGVLASMIYLKKRRKRM